MSKSESISKSESSSKSDSQAEVEKYQEHLYKRLYNASGDGDLDSVKECIQLVADINRGYPDGYGRTPLYIASSNGRVKVVQYLVSSNADIDKACNKSFL